MRYFLRANGAMEIVFHPLTVAEIEKELGAECMESFTLPHGIMMLVDSDRYLKGLPINERATQIHQGTESSDYFISGDAYLCPDEDFGG